MNEKKNSFFGLRIKIPIKALHPPFLITQGILGEKSEYIKIYGNKVENWNFLGLKWQKSRWVRGRSRPKKCRIQSTTN